VSDTRLTIENAEYYLLNRSPGGITIHDPRQLTRACLGGKQINPRHWFRVPRSSVNGESEDAYLYGCGFCCRGHEMLYWNGELMPDG
jgi:hypothetical protein